MHTPWKRILFGNPLPTRAQNYQRLTKVKALAVLSSDALSSVAYATEEILLVLVLAGTAALPASIPIAVVITVLLAIVGTSAVVVLPEVVPAHWWHSLLHNQTAFLLKTVLLYRRNRFSEERVIIDVPYHLKR